jgi:hypothetical protein
LKRSSFVTSAHVLANDVFRTICGRLVERAVDLGPLADAHAPLDGWLEGEAYLACRNRQSECSFGEVSARPTYGSEGVTGADGRPSLDRGGLLVGGVGEPGHHLWVFAEFILLLDGDRRLEDWRARTEAAVTRLLRLGWKRSASVLIVVAIGPGHVGSDWADDLTSLPVWSRSPLATPFALALAGGGSVAARAWDVKRNPADTLTATLPGPPTADAGQA